MQVSIGNTPSFQPVTVSITFESKDELDVFVEMLGYNLSIPELVFRKNEQAQSKCLLENVMTSIHNTLRCL